MSVFNLTLSLVFESLAMFRNPQNVSTSLSIFGSCQKSPVIENFQQYLEIVSEKISRNSGYVEVKMSCI